MNILLHVCCGPCAIYPLRKLREQGHVVTGFFHNPNIHPFREFRRRLSALREMADAEGFEVEIDDRYGLTEYLRMVVHHERDRCSLCYDMRLEELARKAVEKGVDAFTTTLLYSRYQNHSLIREKGALLARRYDILFHYEDFRVGWNAGIEWSREMGLYRQPYCGCIFSEQERYDKKLRKRINTRKDTT
ncbi:MAG: epoxyqueuosine reductase QueH [Desulfobulbaceae bacterium]